MLTRTNHIIGHLFFIADGGLVSLACFLGYVLRFESGWIPPYYEAPKGPVLFYVGGMFALSYLAANIFFKLYKFVPISLIRSLRDVFLANLLASFVVFFFLFFLKIGNVSRLYMIFVLTINISLFFVSRWIFQAFIKKLSDSGRYQRKVLIIGNNRLAELLHKKLKKVFYFNYEIVGFIGEGTKAKKFIREKTLGNYKQISQVIKRCSIDKVFVALSQKNLAVFKKTLKVLSKEPVGVHLVPDVVNYITPVNFTLTDLEDLPILSLRESPLLGYNAFIKRLFDIVFSSLVMVLSFPFLVGIAVLVKLSSPGPVFFIQKRMGLDGKVFEMYKFRSMPIDAESKTGPRWTTKDDKRATPWGLFLRKTSIDEMPQFFNVLKGDMSVVGPRPERPVFIEQFKEEIPEYMTRHLVKAGITGLAQINGWGGDRSTKEWSKEAIHAALKKKIQYDLHYIREWSFLLDLKIIALTPFKGLFNKNA